MTWATPKTDWTTDDAIGSADLNRIETNTQYGLRGKGSDIASGNSISIVNSFHIITGTTPIYYISTAGVLAGHRLVLKFSGTVIVHHKQGSPGAGYAEINTGASTVDLQADADDTFEFIYDGTRWNLVPSL